MDETTTPPRTRLSPACSESLLPQRPWTKQDVCDFFECCENTLDALIRDAGFPPPIMLGGKRLPRWSASAVLAWWQAEQTGASAQQPTPIAPASVDPVLSPGTGQRLGVATRR
jgi:predicted DNA-binding transcriptional regulator AlpA